MVIGQYLLLTESRNQTAYKRPELTIGLSATPMSPLMSSLHQVDGLGADDILGQSGEILFWLLCMDGIIHN